VDPYLHPWLSGAPPTTAISTLIEILGGDHNTTVENVRLKGAPGDARGTNLLAGIHVMLGDAPTPGDVGTGDLTFKNVVAEDMIYGLNVMRFEWSAIKIEDATATNVGTGVDVEGVFDSSVEISNAEIAVRPQGRAGIYLWVIPSGLAVTGNTVTGSPAVGAVYMNNTSNATIAGNTIKDVEVGQWWRAPMYLWRSDDNTISGNHFEAVSGGMAGIRLRAGSSGNALEQNHFVLSGLPGWTATTPYGPGAVMLDASTYGNAVFEMMFPPREGIARCQMIWDMTDDPGTTEYDGVPMRFTTGSRAKTWPSELHARLKPTPNPNLGFPTGTRDS
ncbi:MAG: hypothetical protein GTO22_21280, partial [Gemmatimonadales bacterium]|nr:hypothetical protein [Gemmatimonadales bacterium]